MAADARSAASPLFHASCNLDDQNIDVTGPPTSSIPGPTGSARAKEGGPVAAPSRPGYRLSLNNGLRESLYGTVIAARRSHEPVRPSGIERCSYCPRRIAIGAASPANAATKEEKTFGTWTVTCVEPDNAAEQSRCSKPTCGKTSKPRNSLRFYAGQSGPTKIRSRTSLHRAGRGIAQGRSKTFRRGRRANRHRL